MDAKFEDINWDERIRMAKGLSSHPNFDWKWGTFPQAEANRKGAMDRYCNIKPWNHNRVKLLVTKGQLDYVNASHIEAPPSHDSSLSPLRYIAMQGPTEPSVPYVWRMISEQSESPSVIVQLTSNTEGNFAKCNQYFPDGLASDNTTNTRQHNQWSLNEHNVWGDGWSATLTLESVEFLCSDAIEKRRLSLKVARERYPRVVWHFWYRRWPDFGVIHPEDYATFFELMRLSREHSCPGAPRIIHCSAGVGRTGTFITLEHLLRELDVGAFHPSQFSNKDDNNKDDSNSDPDFVYDTVSHLRQQRKGMVQSDQQYRFLYQVLRRRWIELYKTRGVEDDEEDDNYGGVTLANGIATTNKGDNTKTNAKSTSTSNQLTDVESYDDNDDDDDDDDEDDDEGGAKVKNDSATAPATATATAVAPSDMTVGGVSVSDKLRTVNRSKPFSSGGGRAAMMKKRAKRLLFD
ncbi:hypothetical protein GMORB2_1286 [Geosmithia morbida]|uniref:Protein tyrosine phosphatase n=1 Tax=Geosmithia morbida TaxID=1094350 RepID=A0A9P4Z1N5_9HYPO|nr:uncharacterized protein GMORB2_1286 [Geosmithia morbida]KAF4126040.1 hypothetical protein GMORB2_1286 [Geosmithia morbida]